MKHQLVALTACWSVWCLADVGPRGTQRTAAMSQRVHLAPVDHAGQDPQFASFRADLIAAVRSRDAPFVIAASMPDLQKGFQGWLDLPPSAFASPGREAREWKELERLLALGGSFTTSRGAQKGRREFCAPYTFSQYPMPYPDVAGSETEGEGYPWVVLGANVAVRARPSARSAVLASVSHELVIQTEQVPGTDAQWYKIVAPNGRRGWIAASQLRDPADYHACFAAIEGAWKMTVLEQGMPSWP